MKYAIYSTITGQINKIVTCTPEDVVLQLQENEQYIPMADGGDDTTFYVADNELVPFPAKPSPYHTFDWITKQWVDTRTPETEWQVVREKRDRLLAASDWTQLPDVPLATKEAWAVYRQALRDITLQTDPFNIVWPSTPA